MDFCKGLLMYEILYTKQAVKDIEKLKQTKKLFEKYNEREKLIAENPYAPKVPKGDFSKMVGYKNLYHVRLNQKHRIFYSVTEYGDEVEINIEGIEVEGKVKIMKTYGHDYK